MKAGGNEACPCGSGRKYEQCCLDSAAERTRTNIDPNLSPSQLVAARCRAFQQGDFGFIYDSYHPEAPFLELYPNRRDYLLQGQRELQPHFRILDCRVLKEDRAGSEARVLFHLVTSFQGVATETFEPSNFQQTATGWRYNSSLKLARDKFPGGLAEIDWSDFHLVEGRLRF